MPQFDIHWPSKSSRELADNVHRLNLADRGDISDDWTSHTYDEESLETDMSNAQVEILQLGSSKC
jgi:hypothetical protein